MIQHAKGTFDVKVTPLPAEDGIGHASISRLNLFKQLHGELEGTVHGQMLATGNPNGGAAGYVAMDFVEKGRIGLHPGCGGTPARYWKVREACFRKLKKLK